MGFVLRRFNGFRHVPLDELGDEVEGVGLDGARGEKMVVSTSAW